ncbi:hypothetical protein ACFPU0_04645 [Pseudomonas sp. GCM10022186]|uniref:hypothetical protein n=1 Tax=Pseudomonas sp. GCM10022186 TaxID=3252650 RepID=UPI00362057C9
MAFAVRPYAIGTLIQCFVNGSTFTTYGEVKQKLHRIYFEEYFHELKAKTIVVEENYIDRDYLEDYAAYYDRCFRDYPRRTHRLHFFDIEFTEDDFDAFLAGGSDLLSEQQLQASYLGFVVVKPLPQSVVGRTCLKTYPSDNGRRFFPSLRTYEVHLFGLRLEVQSLAYQEQDTVVAACATSALWSCFQGTGKLFQHSIPPPVEITNWAGEHMPENIVVASARAFPNAGLTASQMAYAVRRVGLEPVVVGTKDRHGLNGVAYAFLRGRIPCVLVCSLKVWKDGGFESIGQHAVAVTGFSLPDTPPQSHVDTGFQLRSGRIDKLYGHDDQVGPFARMSWPTAADAALGLPSEEGILKTSWQNNVYADIGFVLLPLYHKIRIPYSEIHDAMLELDRIAEGVRVRLMPQVSRAEWDIYLTTASDYKTSVREDYLSWGIDPRESLYKELPRFLWRVTVRVDDQVQLEFLFDATGIANHDLLVHAVRTTGSGYALILSGVAVVNRKQSIEAGRQAEAVLNWIHP